MHPRGLGVNWSSYRLVMIDPSATTFIRMPRGAYGEGAGKSFDAGLRDDVGQRAGADALGLMG